MCILHITRFCVRARKSINISVQVEITHMHHTYRIPTIVSEALIEPVHAERISLRQIAAGVLRRRVGLVVEHVTAEGGCGRIGIVP